MQISNPLQINDWEIKNFLKVILAIQLAMWGVIGLDAICLQIPILRQLICFIYLTFIPGILILRILKLHKLGNIETLLYTVGLSLATLMFTGFFMNIIYPLFGISGPISLIPLIVTISVVVLVLCVFCYVRDKDFDDPSFINVEEVLSPPVLFLCFIPFMAILGTYLVNFHQNNILLMLMIIVIAIVTLLICFDKFIPTNLYPLAIWMIAISLIYHVTLISQYIRATDAVSEYYISNLVISRSFWDWTIIGGSNAVLSNAMLAPIFQHIFNMDLTWVFKIIYPLLFSLTSLGVYSVYLKETKNTKITFLSSFLFISIIPFFHKIPLMTKQSTAEIFVVLLVMVILNTKMRKIKRSLLSIIFAISLIVSHYGTSYLVMFSLIFVLLFLFLTENRSIIEIREKVYFKFIKEKWIINDSNVKNNAISLYFVLLFIVFTLAWYIYTSGSSTFYAIVHIGDHIAHTLFTQFLSPEHSRGVHIIIKDEASVLRYITKYLYLTTQFLIIVGFLKTALDYKKSKFSIIYIGLSLYFLIILFIAIAISGFAAMDPSRLFQLSLFFLAPFSVIGGLTIFGMLINVLKMSRTNKKLKYSFNMLSIFLIIFFLFNTGFMYEVVKDHPTSASISQESIKKYGDILDKAGFYAGYVVMQNVFSGRWLATNMNSNERIYRGDLVQGYPSLTIYGSIDNRYIHKFDNTTKEIGDGYVQLSYANVIEGVGSIWYNALHKMTAYNFTDVYPLLEDKNKIYDNGGSQLLWG